MERPLKTLLRDAGRITPFSVKRLELKFGEMVIEARFDPFGR